MGSRNLALFFSKRGDCNMNVLNKIETLVPALGRAGKTPGEVPQGSHRPVQTDPHHRRLRHQQELTGR